MAATILLVVFFLGFPVLVIWLGERRLALVDKVGATIVCYAVGLAIGNIGILPREAAGIQELLSSATVPIALPLLFFSLDLRSLRRAGGPALLSFGLEIVAVLAAVTAAFLLFRRPVGEEAGRIAGMLVGVYTGGTINLVAIGTALRVSAANIVAANTADMVVSALYLLFILTAGRRVLGLVLPVSRPSAPPPAGSSAPTADGYSSFRGILSRPVLPRLAALGLAVLIAAVGFAITLVAPPTWGIVAAIVAITTLGIAASFAPPVRRIGLTHQIGMYFVLVFCIVIGSTTDLAKLLSAAPGVLAMAAVAVFGSLAIHVALASIFRIERDIVIITSVAGIFSPPFVPMVAGALKNRDLLVPGIVTGVIGWVIGNYLGIGLHYALSALAP